MIKAPEAGNIYLKKIVSSGCSGWNRNAVAVLTVAPTVKNSNIQSAILLDIITTL